jgi:hypothetical protein
VRNELVKVSPGRTLAVVVETKLPDLVERAGGGRPVRLGGVEPPRCSLEGARK